MRSQTESSFYTKVLRAPDPAAFRSAAILALTMTGTMMFVSAMAARAMGGTWLVTGEPTSGNAIVATGIVYPIIHLLSAVAIYFAPDPVLRWSGFPLAMTEILACFAANLVNNDWGVTGQLYYYIITLVAAFALERIATWILYTVAVIVHGIGLLVIGPPWIALSEWLITAGVAATLVYGLSTVRYQQSILHGQLTELSRRDPLTGLFNRQSLDETFAAHESWRGPSTLLVLDIDNFKAINDSHGHPFGDHVLRAIAEALQCTVGDRGRAFRIGGDELVAYLPGVDLEAGSHLAQRFIRTVSTTDFEPSANQSIRITCSVGIAQWPNDGRTHSELYLAADAALYEAKRRGRDTICCADEATRSFSAPVAIEGNTPDRGQR